MSTTNTGDNYFVPGDCLKDLLGPIGRQLVVLFFVLAVIGFAFTAMFLESREGTYFLVAFCGAIVLCLAGLFRNLFGWDDQLFIESHTGWEWISPRATSFVVTSIGIGGSVSTYSFAQDFWNSAWWALGSGFIAFILWLIYLYALGAKRDYSDYSCEQEVVHEGSPPQDLGLSRGGVVDSREEIGGGMPPNRGEKPPTSLRGNGGKGI